MGHGDPSGAARNTRTWHKCRCDIHNGIVAEVPS